MTVAELKAALVHLPANAIVRVTCPLGCTHTLDHLTLSDDGDRDVVYAEGSQDVDDVKGR